MLRPKSATRSTALGSSALRNDIVLPEQAPPCNQRTLVMALLLVRNVGYETSSRSSFGGQLLAVAVRARHAGNVRELLAERPRHRDAEAGRALHLGLAKRAEQAPEPPAPGAPPSARPPGSSRAARPGCPPGWGGPTAFARGRGSRSAASSSCGAPRASRAAHLGEQASASTSMRPDTASKRSRVSSASALVDTSSARIRAASVSFLPSTSRSRGQRSRVVARSTQQLR